MTHRAIELGDNDAAMAVLHDYGHVFGRVLDTTFGAGVFWKKVRPANLWTMDAVPSKLGERAEGTVRLVADFTRVPFRPRSFDVVVFDPPYKLNGMPTADVDGMDYRYGVHTYTRWQDRMELIRRGVLVLAPLVAPQGRLIVKCMDQVCSGSVRWQTDMVSDLGRQLGLVKHDRMDLINDPREQPEGRDEQHLEANYSSFIVLRATGRRTKEERIRQAA